MSGVVDEPAPAPARPAFATVRALAKAHAPEVLLYCAARAVGLLVLAVAAQRIDLGPLLGKWDGVWYLNIAGHGYNTSWQHRADGSLVNTNIVFFPLYPMLIRALSLVLRPVYAAVLISWICGAAAAVAIREVGEFLRDRRTGVLLAVLWGIAPTAIVESMAYTESLFTALVAFTLLLVLRRRWLAAAVVCLLAGLTHPYGAALAAAVDISALVALLQRRDGWRPAVCALVAPLGFVGYVGWVAVELGRWNGWFLMEQQGWNNRPSPAGTWHELVLILTRHQPAGYYVTLAVVLLALVSAVILSWRRAALPLLVFTWVSLAMALDSGPVYFHSKARFLLPVFPLLIPLAAYLARLRLRTLIAVLGAGTAASAWYGAYLLTIWPRSP